MPCAWAAMELAHAAWAAMELTLAARAMELALAAWAAMEFALAALYAPHIAAGFMDNYIFYDYRQDFDLCVNVSFFGEWF